MFKSGCNGEFICAGSTMSVVATLRLINQRREHRILRTTIRRVAITLRSHCRLSIIGVVKS